jgi:uncharacterized protein YqfA (UPF0365 family)
MMHGQKTIKKTQLQLLLILLLLVYFSYIPVLSWIGLVVAVVVVKYECYTIFRRFSIFLRGSHKDVF